AVWSPAKRWRKKRDINGICSKKTAAGQLNRPLFRYRSRVTFAWRITDKRLFDPNSANSARSIFDQVLLPDTQTLSIPRNGLTICTLFVRADSETAMEFLTRPCLKCHNPMNGGVYRAAQFCPHCFFEHEGGRKKRRGKVTAVASDADTL